MSVDIKSDLDLVSYLNRLSVAIISTVSVNAIPHSAAVYFVIDQTLNFYFLTLSDTQKAKNLKTNPNVSLTTIDLKEFVTVQASGVVKEITDPQQYTSILKQISEANARTNAKHWPPPVSHLENAGNITIYKCTPNWVRLSNYSKQLSNKEDNKGVFTEFITKKTV